MYNKKVDVFNTKFAKLRPYSNFVVRSLYFVSEALQIVLRGIQVTFLFALAKTEKNARISYKRLNLAENVSSTKIPINLEEHESIKVNELEVTLF